MSNMKIANYTFIINPMQKSTHTGFITVQGTVKHWLYIWMHQQRFILVRSPLKAQNAYKTEANARICTIQRMCTFTNAAQASHPYCADLGVPCIHIKYVATIICQATSLWKLVCLDMNSVITFCHIYIENAVRGSGHCLNIIHWHCYT